MVRLDAEARKRVAKLMLAVGREQYMDLVRKDFVVLAHLKV